MGKAVSFEARGKTWELCYDFNALCRLEDLLGQPIGKLAEVLSPKDGEIGIRDLRAVFCAGLSEDITMRAAGELIEEIGIDRAGDLVGTAMTLAFPASEGAKGGGKGKKKRTVS